MMVRDEESRWLAQENASITGTQTLDTEFNLPWTDYLVDRAVARRDWWVSTPDDYLQWVGDRNVAETAYQASLSLAHIGQGAAAGWHVESVPCPSWAC